MCRMLSYCLLTALAVVLLWRSHCVCGCAFKNPKVNTLDLTWLCCSRFRSESLTCYFSLFLAFTTFDHITYINVVLITVRLF